MIHGCYAWWPELKGCQTQGKTVEETLTDIRKAIELFLETPTDEERSEALSHEILTTAVDVQRRFVRGSDMADSVARRAGLEDPRRPGGLPHFEPGQSQHGRLLHDIRLRLQQRRQVSKSHPHIERPEQRVRGADFVEAHLVDQLLEDQRVFGEQI